MKGQTARQGMVAPANRPDAPPPPNRRRRARLRVRRSLGTLTIALVALFGVWAMGLSLGAARDAHLLLHELDDWAGVASALAIFRPSPGA